MLAPQSLWDSIESSHQTLLETISDALQSPSLAGPGHVLGALATQREEATAIIYRHIACVSECRRPIDAAQKFFSKLDTLCAITENTLNRCASPIGALPIELIQHIMDVTVESPNHWRQVIALSHVSQFWRSVALHMPRLFVSPNWTWPRDALSTWISRAGTSHLQIDATPSTREGSLSQDLLKRMSIGAKSYLHRVQSIRIEWRRPDLKDFPEEFTSIFKHCSLPALEEIIIFGIGPQELFIRLDNVPRLRTLHIPGIPLTLVHQEPPQVRSLGIKVESANDLETAMNIAKLQTNPIHLSLYSDIFTSIKASLVVKKRPMDCWTHVTSLRLSFFLGDDERHAASLASQLDMPNLLSFELMKVSPRVFVSIVNALPEVTSYSVERLLIASEASGPNQKFITPLIVNQHGATAPLPSYFPNLREFALCDSNTKVPSKWRIGFDDIRALVEGRRGVLKQLILPSPFRPQDHLRLLESGAEEIVGQALTTEQHSRLQEAGELVQAHWV
ncbi:hypothetical protein DL93DRAFT_2169234 [Clavulina sp. PMI_390]|nr:hypothetical protein DL93DRAFT_2169234 [Clavulina sp. PMI_390]